MAALLCQGIAQACDGFGQVLCLPCKACGLACSSMSDVLASPFFPYLAITFALNIPCVWLGVNGAQKSNECGGRSSSRWFWLNVALAVGHLMASVYIVQRIREDQEQSSEVVDKGVTPMASVQTGVKDVEPPSKIESGTYYTSTALPMADRQNSIAVLPDGEDVTSHSSVARIKQVLCYDVGVAIYIVVIVVWCIWQTMGVSQLVGGNCEIAQSELLYSLLCGFLYMSFAGVAFACSLCCLR